jgi:Flp pilus assembly protein TadG
MEPRVRRLTDQSGQVVVFMAVTMTVLVGFVGFATDVGSWYLEQRHLQSVVDSAALAGAQALPDNSARASALAQDYAKANGGTVSAVTFSGNGGADTINVTAARPAPGFFSRVMGIDSVTVRAKAAARTIVPVAAQNVSPITIGADNPQLRCGAPCYGQPIQLVALPTGSYNGNMTNFSLVDLRNGKGDASAAMLADWLRHGYSGFLALGDITGANTALFNSVEFGDALNEMRNQPIVLLIHSSANGNEGPAGARYTIVGWAGFVITSWTGNASSGTLNGYFTSVNIQGLPASGTASPPTDYGVRSIALVN